MPSAQRRINPPAGRIVPGIFHFSGSLKLSVRNRSPMFTGSSPPLYISIQSLKNPCSSLIVSSLSAMNSLMKRSGVWPVTGAITMGLHGRSAVAPDAADACTRKLTGSSSGIPVRATVNRPVPSSVISASRVSSPATEYTSLTINGRGAASTVQLTCKGSPALRSLAKYLMTGSALPSSSCAAIDPFLASRYG